MSAPSSRIEHVAPHLIRDDDELYRVDVITLSNGEQVGYREITDDAGDYRTYVPIEAGLLDALAQAD
ncbi:hypothetical protein [Mycobacterium intracellulare]|uniref:hypothetical protein n=1 Tax=Mycobacterium intracellulare TaxID=1767 RepID=UPI001915EFFE|nr:hypothetical protein [Mycobacterium intracellulare]BCO71436.1 hypothetical protein MINTM008_07710 [Mycobacterium intracellulare]BCO76987.1 hypothetical protein MINTM009_07690 [Mycobacterium intracellulare]BCP40677.1 hypothetical protein MINTMi27_07700 [Mycobacterium intracellulare]